MNKNGYVLHMLREKFRRSFRFELLGRAKAFFYAWTFIEDQQTLRARKSTFSSIGFP